MSKTKEKSSPERIKTPSGKYDAIMIEDKYIRNSMNNRRLKEDDETFEEYKMRQKMMKAHLKRLKKGNLVWSSIIVNSNGNKVFSKTYVKSEEEASKKRKEDES